jgi:hypothetical protein
MQARTENRGPDFAALQQAVHHQTASAVLNDPELEPHEKRAILSSWASDLYAVESRPWLREVPGVAMPLRLSDVLLALRLLDGENDYPPPGAAGLRVAGGLSRHASDVVRGTDQWPVPRNF